MHKLHVTVGLFAVGLLVYASPVLAQGIVPCGGADCTVNDFFALLVNIYNWLLGFAAIVAVLMIIFSGVRMLIYYWAEQPEQELTSAKNTLRRAIFGLVVIITAYLVVATLVFTILGLNAGPVSDFLQQLGVSAPGGN